MCRFFKSNGWRKRLPNATRNPDIETGFVNKDAMKRPAKCGLMLALLLAWSAAAGQVIFLEDFDNIGGPTAGGAGTYTFPSGWFLRNVDNRTPNSAVAYVNEAWERREDFGQSVIDSCAFSTSWYNPTGAADDWMWTPLIGPLPANAELKWNAKAYDALYPDGYQVRVMTSSQGPPTGGTGVLGNQITNSTQVYSTAAEAASWTPHTVSLSAFSGQSIYVGFRNNSNDMFVLVIDDVEVAVQVMDDAATVAKDTMEYTIVPERQQSTNAYTGTVRNNSVNTLSNVFMKVIVRDGQGAIIYNANSSTTGSLSPGATANFTVANAGTLPPGNYTIQYIAQHGTTDNYPANDTLENSIVIDPQTYARDDGAVTGNLGIGAGNGGNLGQDFSFPQADVVDSVMVYFTRGYTGQPIQLQVFQSGPSGPTTLVGTTVMQTYLDDSARAYYLGLQGGALSMSPGATYAFEVVEFDSTVAIGLTNSIYTPNSTWVNWPTSPFGTWANNEDFGSGYQRAYVIRPMTACSDLAITNMSSTPSCSGNNGTAAAAIALGYTNGLSFAWSNGDTGSSITALAPGTYTVTVSLLGACSDTASVTVASSSSNPPVGVTTSSQPLCNGGDGTAMVSVSGGTPGYAYLWTTGSTDSSITAPAGSYDVTITDAQGCASTASVTITQPTAITAVLNSTPESGSGANDGTASATPSGGTPPYTYLWSNASTQSSLNSLPAGMYTVTITDANGCTLVDSIEVLLGLANANSLPGMDFRAFPNPSSGSFWVEFQSESVTEVALEVTDMAGRVIHKRDIGNTTGFRESLNLPMAASGLYLLQLRTPSGTLSQRIEIRR